jgi:hypothetical protein
MLFDAGMAFLAQMEEQQGESASDPPSAPVSEPLPSPAPLRHGGERTWTGAISGIAERAGRAVSYDELRAVMMTGPLGRRWNPKSFHGAIGKLFSKQLIVRYKEHVFAPAVFDQFRRDLAAGRVEDLPNPTTLAQLSPLGEAMKEFLGTRQEGVTSSEIIRAARKNPEFASAIDRNKFHPYNVLGRLVAKGEAIKRDGLYYLAPPEQNEPPSRAGDGGSDKDGVRASSLDSQPNLRLAG